MTNIQILSGKDQLIFLCKLAVERQHKNESFTDEEVIALFGGITSVFGDEEASGFLYECLRIHKLHKGRMTFKRAVVEAISNSAEEGLGKRLKEKFGER